MLRAILMYCLNSKDPTQIGGYQPISFDCESIEDAIRKANRMISEDPLPKGYVATLCIQVRKDEWVYYDYPFTEM